MDELEIQIPAFFELVATEACGSTQLRLLLVKREVILALMGCEVYSVDTYDRHRRLDASIVADTVANLRSQAQSTGNSTRFQKGHGETRYDEASRGLTTGNMLRKQRGTEVGDGTSFYRDDGRGNGFNNSQSTNTILAHEDRDHTHLIEAFSREAGHRRDCNYEYSTNNTDGEAASVVVLPIAATASFTGSGSEWRKFTQTSASDTDSSSHITTDGVIHLVRDDRSGQGTHDWNSFFLADVEWSERDFEIRTNRDRTDVRRHAEAHAQGDGDGMSEEKTEGHNAAQGTAKVQSRSDTTRVLSRVENMTVIILLNSQRFRNLRYLYDQLTEQITHTKKQVRSGATPRISQLPCNCAGCCICGPTSRLSACGIDGHTLNLMGLGREALCL